MAFPTRSSNSPSTLHLKGSSSRPVRHLIEITPRSAQLPFLPIGIATAGMGGPMTVHVPCLGKTRYEIEVACPQVTLAFDPQAIVDAKRLPLHHWLHRLRPSHYRARRRLAVPVAECVGLTPLLYGRGAEAHELAATQRILKGWGFAIESRNFQDVLTRTLSPPQPPDRPRTVDSTMRIGIVLHLHYPELWPEFEALLAGLERPFRLLVTTTAPAPVLTERIEARFPGSRVLTYPNRGRDVGPFIGLLADGHLDGLDLVCKLHGKRSGVAGSRAVLGEMWRRASVGDLIGSRDIVDRIVARFAGTPEIGMIGSRRFRLPNAHIGPEAAWGGNRERVSQLMQQLGYPGNAIALDFFAGTMFWVRRDALDALALLGLTAESFPPETGQMDNTLQHALERVFGILPGFAGKRLEDTMWSDETALPGAAPAEAKQPGMAD